jgi:hypothetical protein
MFMKRKRLDFVKRSLLKLAGMLFFTASIACCQAPSGAGVIQGRVFAPGWTPLGGVQVLISSRSDNASPATPSNTVIAADAQGVFTLEHLASGTYAVCPLPPTQDLLPPCSWSKEPRVTVTDNGKTAFVAPIQLQSAVDFYVRVNDPKGKKAANEAKGPGSALFLRLLSPNGRVFPIPMTAKDATGFDHHLRVPAGVDLTFAASSNALTLADNPGQAKKLKQGELSIQVNIPKGQTQHKEVIDIQ